MSQEYLCAEERVVNRKSAGIRAQVHLGGSADFLQGCIIQWISTGWHFTYVLITQPASAVRGKKIQVQNMLPLVSHGLFEARFISIDQC